MLFCWLGEGVAGLLTASLLVALGDAFRSGADQALLYRSCVALERTRDFQRIEATTKSVELIALVALLLVGGGIAAAGSFEAAWIAECALSAAGLAIAWTLVEPPPQVRSTEDETSDSGDARPIQSSWGVFRTSVPVIVPASLLGAAAGAWGFLAQTGGDGDAGTMTLLVAAITLVEAAGAFLSRYLPANESMQWLILTLGVVVAATPLVTSSAFLPAVVGLSLLTGVAEPLRASAIQQAAADHVRAQAASWASAIDKGLSTVALFTAGVLPRR